jgi:hypothetical protein
MELRDLLVVDAESLSAAQAKQVTRDVISELTRGVSAEDQAPLKSLLITAQEIATGRKVGDSQDTIRKEVLEKIQEAEARGDKRTARYLAESMGKHDLAAADLAEQKMTEVVNKFIEDDLAAADALRKKKQRHRIDARTQELLRVNGSEYGFSPEKARKQATADVIGPPAYEDDITVEPEKPNRQTILDAHKGVR